LRPSSEKLSALVPHSDIRQLGCATNTQPLEKRFIDKGALEPLASVLDEAVENDEGANLAMDVSILELLADSAGCLSWAGSL
jgi:hypothetical protein